MTDFLKTAVTNGAVIKVIGVGGGGGNAINSMIASGISGVEFIAANTDLQTLQSNLAPIKIQLGRELTKGLGAGANPEVGRNAALEDKAILEEVLSGADMIFVTAGMGGGTGTGAAPIIAQVARELGALTLGVVTKPFAFEGKKRKSQCDLGITFLKSSVDALITIPNQRLLSIAPPHMTMLDSFKLADGVLVNAVRGISDIINTNGFINQDFADVKKIMAGTGMALMGIGTASGTNRATEAARAAISSPLLEDVDIEGATGILINITASKEITLQEVSEACTLIQESAHEDAEVIFGAAVDESMGDAIRITVIATGFDQANVNQHPESIFLRENQSSSPTNSLHQPFHSYAGNSGINRESSPNQQGGHWNNRTAQPSSHMQAPSTHTGLPLQSNVPRGTSPANHNQTSSQNNQAHYMANRTLVARHTPTLTQTMHLTQNSIHQTATRNTNEGPITQTTTPYGNQAPEALTNRDTAENQKNTQVNNSYLNTEETFINKEAMQRIRSEAEQLTHWTLNLEKTTRNEDQNATQNQEIDIGKIQNKNFSDNTGNSDAAISLAEELAKVEIDETDFETPAFLRKREEPSRSL